MEYGEVGVPDTVTTAQDYALVASAHGADDVRVEEDRDNHLVEVYVSGLDADERRRILTDIKKAKPPSVGVDIIPEDDDPDYNVMRETEYDGVEIVVTEDHRLLVDGDDITGEYNGRPIDTALLHEVKHRVAAGELPYEDDDPPEVMPEGEFLQVAAALDDGGIEDLPKPLVEKYGFPDILEVFENSAAERHENVEEGGSTDATPTPRTVEEAKQAYVDGDIGILEFENRLEDLIEVELLPWEE